MTEQELKTIEERAGTLQSVDDVAALVAHVRDLRKACEAALWAIEDYEREGHPGKDLRPMLREVLR